jgi:hypothetical protein
MLRSISASSLLSLLSNDEDEDDDDVVDGDVVHRDLADGDGKSVGGGGMRRNRQRRRRLRREYESAHHERVRVLGGVGGGRKGFRSDSSRGSGADDDDDGEDETDESMGGGPSIAEDGEDERSRRSRSRTRADRFQMLDSHTLPNFAMESVCHDQMPFAYGEITKVPYVHGVSLHSFYFFSLGHLLCSDSRSDETTRATRNERTQQGFFGAAPFMLTNPHWIGILRRLMPDVYVEISRRAAYAPAPKLIHWAEK